MSEDSNNDSYSTSSKPHRRRKILALIAGCIGVGYFTRDLLPNSVQEQLNISGPDTPPRSQEEANSPEPHTPWEKDTLTVTGTSEETTLGEYYGYAELQNATTFWNDYLAENTDSDLSLTFVKDAENPDIVLHMNNFILTDEKTEYTLPSTNVRGFMPYTNVETVTETPQEFLLPIETQISTCGSSPRVFRHVAKHALGRLIGYPIWSEPVNVMTPKRNFGISHEASPDGYPILHAPGSSFSHLVKRSKIDVGKLEKSLTEDPPVAYVDRLRNAGESTMTELRENIVRPMEGEDSYLTKIEEAAENLAEEAGENKATLNFSNYIEAYEQTMVPNEITYLTETIDAIDELIKEIETSDNSEIENSEAYNNLLDRFQEILTWGSNEPFDIRLHKHVTDAYWSEYDWPENTPEE